jgi:formylglycine-generating enzyme required for sulfatase activity
VTYLAGLPVLSANSGYFNIAKSAPGALPSQLNFRDCTDCSEMVALPSGEFMMGSPESERGRLDVEGLPRPAVIPKSIAIGKFEVTFDQFSDFVAETGMTVGNACKVIAAFDRTPTEWGPPKGSVRQPGFDVKGSQPVVCVSWHDAQAYVAWLQRRTRKLHRLATEAEWEYAARRYQNEL